MKCEHIPHDTIIVVWCLCVWSVLFIVTKSVHFIESLRGNVYFSIIQSVSVFSYEKILGTLRSTESIFFLYSILIHSSIEFSLFQDVLKPRIYERSIIFCTFTLVYECCTNIVFYDYRPEVSLFIRSLSL